MEFSLGNSPSVDVVFRRYDPAMFPKFRLLFEVPSDDNPLRFFAQPSEESNFAVVMENHAGKDVTAMRYNWVMTAQDGSVKKHKCSSDSYMVDVYYPVLKADDRLLICRSKSIHESLIDHVLNGGGTMGGRIATSVSSPFVLTSLRLEIDMLVFADGEIAGPDTERFAAELSCRKPAAEFIAKQVRAAESDHRDVTPVLSALAQVPHLRDDYLAYWTQHYASWYLRTVQHETVSGTVLRHLENRPTLPKFYRR